MLKALVKSGMRYIIWYSGDGSGDGDARALQNTDLTLRDTGKNFAAFMSGYNSIDVPFIVDNNDIYIRNQYAGLMSIDSNNKLTTISPNTYMLPDNYVVRETPTGSVNGTNTIFTLKSMPLYGSEMVFKDGLLQSASDYTISYATITFTAAPSSGAKIRVTYYKIN